MIQRSEAGIDPGRSSSAHIQMVQELYAAFQRRDMAAILSVLSPDVEWSEPENPFNPAGGTRRGHAGFNEWARVGQESEDVLVLEPRHFLAGDDRVAVVGRTQCRARRTGKTYDTDFVHVITFKDRQIVKFQEFFDTFAAAEAFRP